MNLNVSLRLGCPRTWRILSHLIVWLRLLAPVALSQSVSQQVKCGREEILWRWVFGSLKKLCESIQANYYLASGWYFVYSFDTWCAVSICVPMCQTSVYWTKIVCTKQILCVLYKLIVSSTQLQVWPCTVHKLVYKLCTESPFLYSTRTPQNFLMFELCFYC